MPICVVQHSFAKRWDIAITAADEIKKLDKYDLMDEYKMYLKWQVIKKLFSHSIQNSGYAPLFRSLFWLDGKQGIRRAVPTSELVDSYDMADGTPFSWSGSMVKTLMWS
ncbi:hypothetical protein NXX23_20910 [Bacteroides ovatus]|nr:hypothetical protein [Bacteroides ovatus]